LLLLLLLAAAWAWDWDQAQGLALTFLNECFIIRDAAQARLPSATAIFLLTYLLLLSKTQKLSLKKKPLPLPPSAVGRKKAIPEKCSNHHAPLTPRSTQPTDLFKKAAQSKEPQKACIRYYIEGYLGEKGQKQILEPS
tara:strand:- start:148 stop:561 length:414 start_codon:yes stop_codon:yes gene_type:complete